MRAEPVTDNAGLRDYSMRPDSPSLGRWIFILIVFLAGFLCGVATAAAAEPSCVRLKVRPQLMTFQHQDIDVQTRVCRDETHRLLRVEWTSDVGSIGSSDFPLNGERSPMLFQFWVRDQRPANYEFLAIVRDGLGHITGRDRANISTPDANIQP